MSSNLVCALTMRSSFDGLQKLGQRGYGPFSVTYISNLQAPVNISRMATASRCKFSKFIDRKEWTISSPKIGQKGHNLGPNDLLFNFGISSIFL